MDYDDDHGVGICANVGDHGRYESSVHEHPNIKPGEYSMGYPKK
jgi:hypothetical protein